MRYQVQVGLSRKDFMSIILKLVFGRQNRVRKNGENISQKGKENEQISGA